MKILPFLLLMTSFLTTIGSGQTDRTHGITTGDDCGDPAAESQTYLHREGKVTKIKSSTEIIVRGVRANGNPDNRTFTISLIGISPATNSSQVQRFLNHSVLGKKVKIYGNPAEDSPLAYSASVLVLTKSNEVEVGFLSNFLISNGLAAYLEFDPEYYIASYWPCRLEKAQASAKARKVGIWK